MIPDLDIWRSARLLVKHHGPDAPIEAAIRADALRETESGGKVHCEFAAHIRSVATNGR